MKLKKSYGQHLLIAEPTVEKIVRTLAPTKEDTVLEIGPGTGNLTKFLSRAAGHVIAVEKDPEMVAVLNEKAKEWGNVEIINADFLEVDLASLLSSNLLLPTSDFLFCGNLPYNISTPILFKLKDDKQLFSRGLVMVQKEVAKRLTAKPGNKDYGILSIMMQVAAKMKICFDVSPGSFLPPPKVISSVVSMEFTNPAPYHIDNPELFREVVRTAFGQRRKMIRNTIPKDAPQILELAGIAPTKRPEELSIEDFLNLTFHLSRQRQS